jgi:glycosyltransferase involved in cell wall biosynthesis
MPFISVIITAHNRREFLLDAVNSALNQTLPKDEYEIIVVKNFEDERIDKFLEEHNVKNIVTKEEPLGAKIVKGVEESRGEVVSFLEDDDLWLPQKLEIVKQVFKDKDVIYYHNKYRLFISTQNSYNLQDLITYLQENNAKNSSLTLLKNFKCKVANTSVSSCNIYNNSSVSLRKQVLYNHTNQLKKVKLSVDLFLFYLAIIISGYMVFDNRVLTLLRLHNNNTFTSYLQIKKGFENWINDKVRKIITDLNDYKIILEVINNAEVKIEGNHLKPDIIIDKKLQLSRLPVKVEREYKFTMKEFIDYFLKTKGLRNKLNLLLVFSPKPVKVYFAKRWYYSDLKREDKVLSQLLINKA